MELLGTPDTESHRSCRLQSLKSHQSCPIVERITWESLESILLSLGDLEYVVFFIMCAFVLVILEHSLTVIGWWNWLMFTAHLQTWLWKVAHSISWSVIAQAAKTGSPEMDPKKRIITVSLIISRLEAESVHRSLEGEPPPKYYIIMPCRTSLFRSRLYTWCCSLFR